MATQAEPRADEKTAHSEGAAWRGARLIGAVVIALLLFALVVASAHHRKFQSCAEQAQKAQPRPLILCKPLTASDAPVVVGVVLIVLLLLPDFAEVAIPGLLSLKRRVENQERRQDRVEDRLRFVMSQSATAQVNQFVPTLADPKTFDELSRRVDRLEGQPRDEESDDEDGEEVAEDETVADGEPTAAPAEDATIDVRRERGDAERALLVNELLLRAERLSQAAREAEGLDIRFRAAVVTSSGSSFSAPDSTYALMDWWRRFREELAYVQAARNTVAHAKPLDEETLRSAVELARKLEAALPRQIDFPMTPDAEEQLMARARAWLNAQGIRLDAKSFDRRFDLTGVDDGRKVLIELKLTRREATRTQLVGWIAQLQDLSRSFPDARLILIVSTPRVRRTALELAHFSTVETYFEIFPGEFRSPTDLISESG